MSEPARDLYKLFGLQPPIPEPMERRLARLAPMSDVAARLHLALSSAAPLDTDDIDRVLAVFGSLFSRSDRKPRSGSAR